MWNFQDKIHLIKVIKFSIKGYIKLHDLLARFLKENVQITGRVDIESHYSMTDLRAVPRPFYSRLANDGGDTVGRIGRWLYVQIKHSRKYRSLRLEAPTCLTKYSPRVRPYHLSL